MIHVIVGAAHDDSDPERIMFGFTGSNPKTFGQMAIDSFLVPRNDKCIT